MDSTPVSFFLGDTAVSIFTIGHLMADLAAWYGLLPEAVDDEIRPYLERPLPIPVQSILIKRPDITLLVDAPHYDIPDSSPYAIPDYEPPPGLVAQLAQVGILPEEVTHVIITHHHFDHFNGLTVQINDEFIPVFENAQHYLSLLDWQTPEMQVALTQSDSLEHNTFGILHQQGLLELITGDYDLGHGMRILPAPGETFGHRIVRLAVGDDVLYCLGDLFHHKLEVWRPETIVQWANAPTMKLSQRWLIERALADNAWLIASHIAGYGRLVSKDNRLMWKQV